MVIGDVIAQDAVIFSRILGKLMIADSLRLHASSDVDGGIDTLPMLIEEGATVNSTLKMANRDGRPASSAA